MNKTAEKTPAPPHDLILEGRSKLTVTGVKRVLRCDADSAAMETGKGVLHLTGAELNVTSLDLESGEVRLTGRIDALEYTAERTPPGPLRRLLRQLLTQRLQFLQKGRLQCCPVHLRPGDHGQRFVVDNFAGVGRNQDRLKVFSVFGFVTPIEKST